MGKTISQILKADEVAFEGQFQLDVSKGGSNTPKGGAPAVVAPGARIIESNSEFAVIEITCSCGRTARLRCEYAPNEAS